jgi:Zinc-finger
MGKKPRKIKTAKEAVKEIGKLEENYCKKCTIKTELREQGQTYYEMQFYCMNECKIGRKIRALGGIIEYGAMANNHFKAPELTKDKYLKLKSQNMTDAEIREKYGISRITLTRRKQAWGLTKVEEFIKPRLVLKDMTKEKLEELSKIYTDQEIADMYNVSKVTIQKRRKKWGIEATDHTIKAKFTIDEYKYLSKKKGLTDKEIAELWDISTSSLLKLKKEWGIVKPKKLPKPEELGLTREKMLELVPNYTDQEIAEMYGLYPTTITKYRKKLGIPHTLRLPRNRIKPEQIKELLASGKTKGEIAEELGIHRTTLAYLIKEFREKNLL